MSDFEKSLATPHLFANRHIGISPKEREEMLRTIGVDSLDTLVNETIPEDIFLENPLNLPEARSEHQFLGDLKKTAQKNEIFRSYIGMGYYNCIVPGVILRNVLENPGWYTAYTPYQAEIAQGRLEALLNFQTMVADLTGMEIANASLLDEGTAAAEAMMLLHRSRARSKKKANTFLVSENCLPHTIDILKTRAEPIGITLQIGDVSDMKADVFGILLQYPDCKGNVKDHSALIEQAHQHDILAAVAADLLSLTLLKSPGEMGADVVLGSAQRFGVPMGYGGPHAAYFATREAFKRQVPGRIIGVSVDRNGKKACRMALQTREQHIRREKATSNICTAQTLLAVMASMYAVYHGPDGLRNIARQIHRHARRLEKGLSELGYQQSNAIYFDTLHIQLPEHHPRIAEQICFHALREKINFYYPDARQVQISLDETTRPEDVENIVAVFARALQKSPPRLDSPEYQQAALADHDSALQRQSDFLTHEVFQQYHTETNMLRYLKQLENKDLSLTTSMIALGSCTMKLNATAQMIPVTWPEFCQLHPFAPAEQTRGYQQIFTELEAMLCEITGFSGVSLQPNSGAQGEFAGMMVIRAYHQDRGETQRDVVLIPGSAHGTNPASGIMAGLNVVTVKCDANGNIELEDLRNKAVKYKDTLAALMVTYPSTHGVFEKDIREICDIIHQNGGQVYMDGANMNAQVGLTSPARIGADVCHLNLHKTFSIPHGGGGPGMGPIGVAEHLAPYLPGHVFVPLGGAKAIPAISAAPWGSANILLISYAYICLLGQKGVTEATRYAILNANYLKSRLEKYYPALYTGENGRVAHELIIDPRAFKQEAGIEVEDIAKRLMDYGFHAPTMSFPVIGTMMIEPTESESKAELDRFCEAMIAIYEEIQEIKNDAADKTDNVLKNAPHAVEEALSDHWQHAYGREKAVYPLPFVKANKFWPASARIDNAHGDRHLICSCPPMSSYETE